MFQGRRPWKGSAPAPLEVRQRGARDPRAVHRVSRCGALMLGGEFFVSLTAAAASVAVAFQGKASSCSAVLAFDNSSNR